MGKSEKEKLNEVSKKASYREGIDELNTDSSTKDSTFSKNQYSYARSIGIISITILISLFHLILSIFTFL
jgi:hypothetical protein